MCRFLFFFAAVGLLPSSAILAQSATGIMRYALGSSDERILNAPYSAKRHFTSDMKRADGTNEHSDSGGSEARDSQGRTYSAGERHWTYFDGKENVLKSEMLYRIDDPIANTQTRWDTTTKVVTVIYWPQSTSKEGAREVECQTSCDDGTMDIPGVVVEKLGEKIIGGVMAEGIRSSYTIPAGQDNNSKPVIVVHERWFSPELKIVILETNDDPRSGSTKNELTDIVRGEPDTTQYRPPADYIVRKIKLPLDGPGL